MATAPNYTKSTYTKPTMVAVYCDSICLICSKHIDQAVQLVGVEDLPRIVEICQPCINEMYAKACAEFNIRPHKLY